LLSQLNEQLTARRDQLGRLEAAIAALENRLTSVPHN
jgi:hypothetical protein